MQMVCVLSVCHLAGCSNSYIIAMNMQRNINWLNIKWERCMQMLICYWENFLNAQSMLNVICLRLTALIYILCTHVVWLYNSASEMFVNINIKSFGELLRVFVHGFRSRIVISRNFMLSTICNSPCSIYSKLWAWWRTLLYVHLWLATYVYSLRNPWISLHWL